MSQQKPKILGMTDSTLKSGFGIVMHNILNVLGESEYESYLLGWGFRYDEAIKRGNYLMIPTGNHPFGADVLPSVLNQLRPEALIVQADTRMVDWLPQLLKQSPYKPTWIFYPVIDGHVFDTEGKCTKWPGNWTAVIKEADVVVAMSQYGQNILKANGIEKAKYIPHGVDTTVFRPLPDEERQKIKMQANLQGKTVIGGIFKNIQRKNPEKYLQAYALLTEGKRDKFALLLHTQPNREYGGEADLVQQATDIGLIPGKDIIFSTIGVPTQNMPALYNAMDIFWALGGMEGFNVPLIEAMSCGVPTVAINATTHKEILGDTGLLTEVPPYPGSKGCPMTYGSYNGIEGCTVNPWDLAKKTQMIIDDKVLREKIAYKEVERAITVYDWSIVRKQWLELVKSSIVTSENMPTEWKKIYEST